MNKIIVETTIDAPIQKVWQCWIQPEHITKWNFASDNWHCPSAENNLVVGREFHYTMADICLISSIIFLSLLSLGTLCCPPNLPFSFSH